MTWLFVCPVCEGTGERDWLEGAPCYRCHSAGRVPEECPDCGGQGFEEVYAGHGNVAEVTCTTCRGTGHKTDPKREGETQQKETAA